MKISANMCKKVPAGTPYSSQAFGASLEIELPDSQQPQEVLERLHRLYAVLAKAVEGQIAAATAATAATAAKADGNGNGKGDGNAKPASPAAPARPAAEQGGNGGAIRFIPATAAQQRAVYAICRELGIEVSAVLAENGVAGMERLGLRQASQIIDKLKSRKGR